MSISSRSLTLVVSIIRYLCWWSSSLSLRSLYIVESLMLLMYPAFHRDGKDKNWNLDHLKTHEMFVIFDIFQALCISESFLFDFWLHKQAGSCMVYRLFWPSLASLSRNMLLELCMSKRVMNKLKFIHICFRVIEWVDNNQITKSFSLLSVIYSLKPSHHLRLKIHDTASFSWRKKKVFVLCEENMLQP